MQFEFSAALWLYPGQGAWVFVTVPKHISREIKHALSGLPRRGFGSARVTVMVRGATWKTSIFPDKKAQAYILPIKKAIREQLSMDVGDEVEFGLDLVDIF